MRRGPGPTASWPPYGVAKIPTYVVEGQPLIPGSRRPAVLVEALRAAAEKAQR
jgi:predicted DsbA family dithiol-disulfide isomerase